MSNHLIVPGDPEPVVAPPPGRAGVAVVLLSGGLNSAVAAAKVRADGFAVACLTLDYGQPRAELAAAARLARTPAIAATDHLCVKIGLAGLAPCPRLTGGKGRTPRLPSGRTLDQVVNGAPSLQCPAGPGGRPPASPSHVPGLHLLLLTLGTQYAEVGGADVLVVGFDDTHARMLLPGTRPEFLQAWMAAVGWGTGMAYAGRDFRLRAPLLELGRGSVVRLARTLGVPAEMTLSCLRPGGLGDDIPCGDCDGCVVRRGAFAAADGEDAAPGTPPAHFPGDAPPPALDPPDEPTP